MADLISRAAFRSSVQTVLNDTTCPIHIAAEIEQYLELEPTIYAIPVEWLREKMHKLQMTDGNPFGFVLAEWLKEQNILGVEYSPRASSTTCASTTYIQTVSTQPAFYRPIPADIAQRLGIDPKGES